MSRFRSLAKNKTELDVANADNLIAEKLIFPAQRLRGEVSVPGDKSISHRALLLAAISEGTSRIYGISSGADVRSTMACLQKLGVDITRGNGETRVAGRGAHGLSAPDTILDAGNSGTTMRLLTGILAGQPFTATLDGDASLRRRPMRRIITPLAKMGAKISATPQGTAPLTITGGTLQGITYRLPVASAQVKSAILLAGMFAQGETTVIEPLPTRNHTELMLQRFGVALQQKDGRCTVRASKLRAADVQVPGDFSSAAFLIAAALMVPESELVLRGIGVNPTRCRLLELLVRSGAAIRCEHRAEAGGEAVADVIVCSSRLRPFSIEARNVPLLIDEIPVLAVVATQVEGESVIRGAQELRHKESDRLHTLAINLGRMGALVKEFEDGLAISGPVPLKGAIIDAYGDHRIAMAFAVAGLVADGETIIRGADVADVSFPGFFEILEELRGA